MLECVHDTFGLLFRGDILIDIDICFQLCLLLLLSILTFSNSITFFRQWWRWQCQRRHCWRWHCRWRHRWRWQCQRRHCWRWHCRWRHRCLIGNGFRFWSQDLPRWCCSGPVVGDIALACPWTPASSSASSEQRVLVCSMMQNPNHEWRSGYDATQLVSHHPGQAAGKKVPPHRIQTCGIHLLPMIMIKCTPNDKFIIYTKTFLYHHHELHFVVSMPIYIDTLSLFQVIMIYIYIFVHYKKQW